MGKNVGLTYVKDFEFPAEQGFTGSASPGVHQVRGYQRGGRVKKMGEGGYYGKPGDKYPKSKARQKMPKNVKAKGGPVKKQMGGYMGPEREISVDDVKISVPKKHGGKMSTHDKLKHQGKKMGYAYGGQVKDTSGEFVAKRGKQDTMDTGVQPARRGGNARNAQEKEAGGTGRLKPGLKKGGRVKKGAAASIAGAAAGAAAGAVGAAATRAVHRVRNVDKTKGKGRSKKGFPKTVKAKGGLATYAHGGYAAGDKKTHPTGRGRKPYTGYNKQPGGSGNEDARYMRGSKRGK